MNDIKTPTFNPWSEDPATQDYTCNRAIDALHIVDRFVLICQQKNGVQLTDEEFIKEMQSLFEDCDKLGLTCE